MEQASGHLPLRAKLLYASSSLGGEALSQSRGLWLLYYYAPPKDADIEGILPLGVVGALLFAARLVESFDDALIGYWSDRTRSRLGRRIPFILGATPFWALFGVLLFTPPADAGRLAAAVYLFVALELFFLFGTLSGGPYEALLPELARTSADRVSIVGMRVYFGAAGAVAGLALSPILVDRLGFQAMALVMGGLALAFRYAGMAGIWRRATQSQDVAEIPFREAMRETFANRAFLFFLPSFVLFQIGLQMLLGVLPYYVDAVLGKDAKAAILGVRIPWESLLTFVAIGSALVSVLFFARAARRTSKRQAYSAAMLGAALGFPILAVAGFVAGVPAEAQVLAAMVVAGAPLAGVYLFPAALTADIADHDAVRTGLRREGVYFGAQNFVEKTTTSTAPLILAGLLSVGNTAADPLGIRLVGPVAGALVLVAYLVFRSYDLPDEILPPTPATALAAEPAPPS